MKQNQFTELVQRLEQYAKAHPKMYKARILGLMVLGYGYLLFLLLVLLGLTGGIAYLLIVSHGSNAALMIKLWIVMGVLLWTVARALFVRIPPPEGIRLKPADAPELFAMIEKLRLRVGAPRMNRVLLDGDFNASVSQYPRLGLFGWHRNYLMIGLPMLYALTPAQLEAVLAHELGHLSGEHGRLGVWIYRVRASWSRLVESLEQNPVRGASLVMGFFFWHAPRFYAWTCVLAREHEYDADRAAARLAGADTCARALIATEIQGAFLAKIFYPELQKRASAGEQPPDSFFGEMARRMRAGHAREDLAKWLGDALQVKTGTEDSHPCLSDRLKALGVEPAPDELLDAEWIDSAPVESASSVMLLGAHAPELRRQLDEQIRQDFGQYWSGQQEEGRQMRQRLAELEAKGMEQDLSADEASERALLVVNTRGAEAGAPLLLACATRSDATPMAIYRYGGMLLEQDDEEGLEYLNRAIERDQRLTLPGCELAIGWLKSKGRDAEANPWLERGEARYQLEQRARRERSSIHPEASVLPHDLPDDVLKPVRAALSEIKTVKQAYLVRKEVHLLPERPCFVLVLKIKFPMLSYQSDDAMNKVCEKAVMKIDLPSEFLVVPLDAHLAKMERQLKTIPGACIYTR